MDPLGTAAQAGGTVCWKGQEQGCQYQGTANRIFYKLALIKWGGRAVQEPYQCIAAHQCCPKRAGSISWRCHSSATQWNHQRVAGSEGAASRRGGWQLALRPPDPALLPGSWCDAGYDVTYNQAPWSTGSHQTDSKFHHVLPAPHAVAVHLTHGDKVLRSPLTGLSPTPGQGTDVLPQPAPALSTLLCTYTSQVVQPDIYKALSNA